MVNLATLLWAGNVVLGRALREQVGPWTLACGRAAIASALFTGILWSRRERNRRPTPREAALLLGMALSGVVLFQGLQYAGLHYTSAVNAGVINGAGPLLTLLLARVIIADAIRPIQVLGSVLSLGGVVAIVGAGALTGSSATGVNPGDLLILVAVTLWGVYSILGRILLAGRDTFWVTGVSTTLAVPLLLLPAAAELRTLRPIWDPSLVLALLYIGIGPSFFAFLAWNEGVRRLGPGGAMSFYNTLPVFVAGLSWLFLGEAPGLAQWCGGALVILGCLLASRGAPTRL